ncbi:MAG: 2TM domain-containing protein [Chloroflexota bacterium]
MDEHSDYQRALERVRALRGFYVHLMVYVAVNLGLMAIDWLTDPPGLTWAYYPLVGWGVALAIHALNLFVADGLFGPRWEERKVRELLSRERSRREQAGEHGLPAESDEVLEDLGGRSTGRPR